MSYMKSVADYHELIRQPQARVALLVPLMQRRYRSHRFTPCSKSCLPMYSGSSHLTVLYRWYIFFSVRRPR